MLAIDTLPTAARQAFEDLQAKTAGLETENFRLQKVLQLKDEQIKLLNFRLFGPKSEKLSSAQIPLLLGEISLSASEVEQEAERPEAEKQNPLPRAKIPRPHHPGREKLPEHLERREQLIPCCPEDCRCEKCGDERPVIGYETREELACEPAKFWVRVLKREKRGSHCLEEQGVVTATAPAQIVPKGKLSNEFIIEVLAQKYQQHNPVYRQQAVLADNHGIELSRKTLTDALLASGSLLRPVVQAQKAELFAGGYGVYDDLGEVIVYAGCLSHARRGFVDAAKVAPLDPLPPEVIARFGELYAVEKQAREAGFKPEERRRLRQTRSVPVMAAFKERLVAIRQQITPGGTFAKACDYALGQWSRLEEYLRDGRIEIDNNWCEGAIRPLVLGRKNWLHIGSEAAGPKVAGIASVVETCRRLDINLRKYLNDVLPRLGDWPINRVAELTPTAWKAAQQS